MKCKEKCRIGQQERCSKEGCIWEKTMLKEKMADKKTYISYTAYAPSANHIFGEQKIKVVEKQNMKHSIDLMRIFRIGNTLFYDTAGGAPKRLTYQKLMELVAEPIVLPTLRKENGNERI